MTHKRKRQVGHETDNHCSNNERRQRQEYAGKLSCGSLASDRSGSRRSSMPILNVLSRGLPCASGRSAGFRWWRTQPADAWKTAQNLAASGRPIIIDTPGFRSQATLACIAAADFLLVPVKASPLDVDRMLDTLNSLIDGAGGKRPTFRCILTQTIAGFGHRQTYTRGVDRGRIPGARKRDDQPRRLCGSGPMGSDPEPHQLERAGGA